MVGLRWFDEQKRLFGIIYWVDLVLLLAGMMVIGKAVWSFWPTRPVVKDRLVYITIEAASLHPEVAKGIQPGAWLKDARSGVRLGTVIRKKVAPHYIVEWESNKELKRRAFPERLDMLVTLRQSVRFKEDEGFFIGAMPLRAGRKGVFYTMLAEFKGEVIQVANPQPDEAE